MSPLTGTNEIRRLLVERREVDRLWPPGAPRDALEVALQAAADPQRALDTAVEAAEARARRRPRRPPWHQPDWIDLVVTVAGASRSFGQAFRRHPRLAERIAADPFLHRPKQLPHHLEELGRRTRGIDPEAPDAPVRLARLLRRHRQREMIRLAWRDLSGDGRFEGILQELSDLAAASFEAALSVLYPRLRAEHPGLPQARSGVVPGFCVLGMGKLGGGELNFSSDVDVLYLYDAREVPPEVAFPFYARLAEQVTRALGEVTEDGFVFRVDLDLRPEGRSGPVVNSVRALEAYYEGFGRTWERQALLKARPVAGDLAVGEAALEALRPFVHRRSLDLEAVRRVVALKDEMDRRVRARGDVERDLKLGRGGIRAIELVVQSLQLLFAGKAPRLRDRTTLGALERLLFAGHLDESEVRALSDAYLFLRRTEHRIQMVDDRQTARLPEGEEPRANLARAMGYLDPDPWPVFAADLEAHRERVQAILERRFGRPEVDPEVPESLTDALTAALDPELPPEVRLERLANAGFDDADATLAHLTRLARRPWSPFGHSPTPEVRRLGPLLLAEAVRSPDPAQAVRHLAELFDSLPRSSVPGWLDVLQHHPTVRRRLISLFGTSDTLARDFLRRTDALDTLLLRDQGGTRRNRRAAAEAIRLRLHTLGLSLDEDPEAVLVALRRHRGEEVLRIGLADISGALSVEEVGHQLTDLAEALLDAAVELAAAEARRRWGWPVDEAGEEVPLAVVGLGKLGGREMGYASDLDVMFLYGGAGATDRGMDASEFFSRLAQRLIAFITRPLVEGSLYEIDTRLRPSGRQGMLVTSLSAFSAYHREKAATWEQQALVRARAVAGPDDFKALVDATMAEAAWRPVDPARMAAEIRRLRARIEQEVGRETDGRRHPKAGRGGLLDVEFLVQYLQLVSGWRDPLVRSPGTIEALRALAREGLIPAAEADRLERAWTFLRRLEGRLQLVVGRPVEHLPTSARHLEGLARRMGYRADAGTSPAEALLEDYDRITGRNRESFQHLTEGS